MSRTRIGVVIPTMNSSATIEATLRSVINQSIDGPLLVRVQDNSSTDHTLEIVARISESIDKKAEISVEIDSQPDSGVAQALNIAFQNLDADLLTWLGSDDLLIPGAINTVSSLVEQTDARWVTGLPTAIDMSDRQFSLLHEKGVHRYPSGFPQFLLQRGLFGNGIFGGVQQEGTFWTRELWEQSGGFLNENYRLAFDFELWTRMARYSELVQVVAMTAAFRVRPNQLSSNTVLYAKEKNQVRKSLRQHAHQGKAGFSARQLQRPIAYRTLENDSWTVKRFTVRGKPLNHASETARHTRPLPKLSRG